MDTLVLIGFMGAGKSRAARALAAARGIQALDSDALLEERLGHSIAQEFEAHGEEAFRAKEEELVCGLLADAAAGHAGAVIALGGGSVLSARVREALAGHLTVLLDVDAETAWERARGAERPLAREREQFFALHSERRALYEGLADGTLLWADASSGAQSAGYPVFVGAGLLSGAGWSDALWPLDRTTSRCFCVTDETVGVLYHPPPGSIQALIPVSPGERHKTLATAEEVWETLAQLGMTRADHLVALGGGVVGDLAGFCAATYQRGVPVVQVPTTLVAQVDSAYGGKTGVDLPQAKNYVGAYHQPAGVIVDPDALGTLPQAEFQSGWVEVLKTALIAGGELWRRIAADEPVDERTILACARTKLAVVAEDERDGGRRQVLNLGHTVGHAIETATGYALYRHGEAVGLGLLAALRLSGQDALREQVRELLLAHELPVTLEGAEVEPVLKLTARDKKRLRAGAATPFVLVDAPGEVRVGCEVAADKLRAAVAEFGALMAGAYRIEVMHGVNLNMLGQRDPEHYGTLTLMQLEQRVAEFAAELDLEVRFLQTNAEAEFIEHLQGLPDLADGIVLNPGAWTHYSWAIRDALEIAALPAVEVHLSDVKAREEWRRVSVIEELCLASVCGKGVDGYREALAALRAEIEKARS